MAPKVSKRGRSSVEGESSAPANPPLRRLPQLDLMGLHSIGAEAMPYWDKLTQPGRKVQAPKWFHNISMQKMGFYDHVYSLMKQGGLEFFFLNKKPDGYVRETLEFLSTFSVTHSPMDKYLRFSVNGRIHHLTFATLRGVFGFAAPKGDWTQFDRSSTVAFWTGLTGLALCKSYQKARAFPHPAWRVIWRVLAMCFFDKGEPTQIGQTDLPYLQCMLPGVGEIFTPDWLQLFIDSCTEARGKVSGHIPMSGMIGMIVESTSAQFRHSEDALKLEKVCFDFEHLRDVGEMKFDDKHDAMIWLYGWDKLSTFILPPTDDRPLPHGPNPSDWYILPNSGALTPPRPSRSLRGPQDSAGPSSSSSRSLNDFEQIRAQMEQLELQYGSLRQDFEVFRVDSMDARLASWEVQQLQLENTRRMMIHLGVEPADETEYRGYQEERNRARAARHGDQDPASGSRFQYR